MSNQWLRLWHDMPTDPKWRTIAKVSGQRIGDVMAVYLHLLVSASTNPVKRGETQCNAEDVSSALDIEITSVEAIFSAMQGRVIGLDNHLTGWEARQPKREDNSTSRVKKHRQNQTGETQCNAVKHNVTLDKEEDKDKERKEKNTKKEIIYPEGFLKFFEKYPAGRRGNKEKAYAAWNRALERAGEAEILSGLEAYCASELSKTNPKGAEAWLNDDRWKWDYSLGNKPFLKQIKPIETRTNIQRL